MILVKIFENNGCVCFEITFLDRQEGSMVSSVMSVSYTHLTLPTKRIV